MMEITKPTDNIGEAALRKWAYAKGVPYEELQAFMKSQGRTTEIIEIKPTTHEEQYAKFCSFLDTKLTNALKLQGHD